MRMPDEKITDTNSINRLVDKEKIYRIVSVMLFVFAAMLNFTGCADHELHRYVTEWKTDEIEEDSLGEIVTAGEFYEVDSNNMLRYKGAYKGLDYVTLVFDNSSPVNLENVELCISEQRNFNHFFEGILYQEKDGNKYITFKYETIIYRTGGQHEATRGVNTFILPTNAEEPMSYYLISIKPLFHEDYEAGVSEYIQKESVDRSYYTDYIYDVMTQYYDRETDRWTEEILEDLETNNMPLE